MYDLDFDDFPALLREPAPVREYTLNVRLWTMNTKEESPKDVPWGWCIAGVVATVFFIKAGALAKVASCFHPSIKRKKEDTKNE